jgi:aspartate kinase
MFQALADAGINIQMITTSEIKISVLINRASAVPALRAVHQAFRLDQLSSSIPSTPGRVKVPDPPEEQDDGAPEPRTRGMEDLVIDDVLLDEKQAQIALFHVPDRPGYAARVFRAIAEAGVFVDMIVQNVGIAGDSVLSFTVARDAADRAIQAVHSAGVRDVSAEPAMAKLSVVGVGMRTHTGAATRMFAALAERGININLINTSEVRINVGTDLARGREGLECLKRAFDL